LTGCGEKDPVSKETKDLKSGDPLKRESAILHIARMGVPGRASLPALIQALEDPEANVRKAAAGAIGTLGKGDADAAAALAALAKDADWQVRIAAVEALRSMDEKEKMVTVCIAVIEGDSAEARLQAISPLSTVGPAAAPAVKALTKALQASSDVNVKLYCALALGNIGPKAASAIPALEEAAGHSDENVSKAAKEAIGKINQ
jgi:HEAT repeat protein